MSNALLSTLSLAQLAVVYNEAVSNHSPEGFSVVKKFGSKEAGVARIEKLVVHVGGELREVADEPYVAVVAPESVDPHAAGDLDLPEVTEVEEGSVDEPAEEVKVPFVKLSKEELAALGERGTPAREAYRKARRAAARAARKAREAAASA